MKRKTPQEKKILSYEKDCRNTYGENDKSSRKNIPLRKAKSHRAFRKKVSDILQQTNQIIDLESLEVLESEVKSVKKGDWKKYADLPLGEFVERQIEYRESYTGKGKTFRKKLREDILENRVK